MSTLLGASKSPLKTIPTILVVVVLFFLVIIGQYLNILLTRSSPKFHSISSKRKLLLFCPRLSPSRLSRLIVQQDNPS